MVSYAATEKHITPEDYLEAYYSKGYEYVDGQPYARRPTVFEQGEWVVPPPSFRHGLIGGRIATLLGHHIMLNALRGRLLTECACIVDSETQEIRRPDLAYLSAQNLQMLPRLPGVLPFAPDFVLEIVSPSEDADALRIKAQKYMRGGTRLLWVVYPGAREIDVYAMNDAPQTLRLDKTLDGGDVFPTLSIPIQDIFSVVDVDDV